MADQGEPRPAYRPLAAAWPDALPLPNARPSPSHVVALPGSRAPAHGSPTQGDGVRLPSFAALDLGTNNCRLLIARPAGEDFVVVDAFSRIVRLGEGLAASGRLGDAAMTRAVDALSICADKLARRRVALSRAVATEACRQASNGAEFLDRVRRETGIVLDIIAAEEEARLAVLGCYQQLGAGPAPGVIFDIGGGSTELALVDDRAGEPMILDWHSVPWGVVSLTEAFRHDSFDAAARTAGYAAMRAAVRPAIRAFADRIAARRGAIDPPTLRLLGTSGTVTTLASLHVGLTSYDRSRIDGLVIEQGDLRALCGRLADLTMAEREALPCVGRERADLVVAGCAVFEEILDIWPAPAVHVADRGIREGILRALIRSPFGASLQRQRASATGMAARR